MNKEKTIGRNIYLLRDRMGLTQLQLGEAIGLSRVEINYYENATRPMKLSVLEKIADYLGVELADLSEATMPTGIAFAFRKEKINAEDSPIIIAFRGFVKGYLKLLRIEKEYAK